MGDMTPLRRLSEADVYAVDDLATEDVPVPEWGGFLTIRPLTADERVRWQRSFARLKASGEGQEINEKAAQVADLKLIVMSAVNEDGSPFFADAEAVKKLAAKSGAATQRVVAACMRISRLRKRDAEELLGNSETAPDSSSFTT